MPLISLMNMNYIVCFFFKWCKIEYFDTQQTSGYKSNISNFIWTWTCFKLYIAYLPLISSKNNIDMISWRKTSFAKKSIHRYVVFALSVHLVRNGFSLFNDLKKIYIYIMLIYNLLLMHIIIICRGHHLLCRFGLKYMELWSFYHIYSILLLVDFRSRCCPQSCFVCLPDSENWYFSNDW